MSNPQRTINLYDSTVKVPSQYSENFTSKSQIFAVDETIVNKILRRERSSDANSASAVNKRAREFNYEEKRHKQGNRGYANLNENFAPRSRLLITGLRSEPEESLAVSHSPAKSVIPKRAVEAIRALQPNSIELLATPSSSAIGLHHREEAERTSIFAPPRRKFASLGATEIVDTRLRNQNISSSRLHPF